MRISRNNICPASILASCFNLCDHPLFKFSILFPSQCKNVDQYCLASQVSQSFHSILFTTYLALTVLLTIEHKNVVSEHWTILKKVTNITFGFHQSQWMSQMLDRSRLGRFHWTCPPEGIPSSIKSI